MMRLRPELSDSIGRMIFKNDEDSNCGMTAAEWIRTYDDLDALVADCDDYDDLWVLSRIISEDALESGYGDLDVGEIMQALLRHWQGGQGRAEKVA